MTKTFQSTGGTSFHGSVIVASVNELTKIMGEPHYSGNDGEDKVNYEWEMETENGAVFTVYDWKAYRSIGSNEQIEWHIGGQTRSVTEAALDEIATALCYKID